MPSTSIPTDIKIAKICQYMAASDIQKKKYQYGRSANDGLPRLLRMVRFLIEWMYGFNPNDQNLQNNIVYMKQLCAPYLMEARNALGNGSGTVVIPSTGAVSTIHSQVLQFFVGDPGAPILDGQNSMVLNIANVMNASMEVLVDTISLPFGSLADRWSVNVAYSLTTVTVTFNFNVVNGQLILLRYLQIQA